MFECIICLENFKSSDEVFATTCGHIHHSKCLEDWRSRSKECPQCRAPNPTTYKIFLNFDGTENEVLKAQLQEKDGEIAELQRQSAANESRLQHSLEESQKICAELQENLEEMSIKFESIELDNVQKVLTILELQENLKKLQEAVSQNQSLLRETGVKSRIELEADEGKVNDKSSELNKDVKL